MQIDLADNEHPWPCHASQPMQAFKEMLVLWTSAFVGSF